ncbi:transcriptional regulator swi6 [Myotisia sp. PD_48]|nr:transcriptional regulator swi6 [Myotisia sp. PD_48]
MSFSVNSHPAPATDFPHPRSRKDSFRAPQSVASTPAASPPPRASQLSTISASFSNPGIRSNSISRNKFASFEEPSRYDAANRLEEHKPQIYTAVYSNVSVYEMEVNGVAVMRRRSDSWLNATQILKVAGVAKARRTKTLEKEVAAGEHEKVQGGYGKYQGTWVDYNRGVGLCKRYQVESLLRPLLEYDMGQDGVTAAGQGALDTPTKEQAMAVQRKRFSQGLDGQGSSSQHGTYFQNISRTAASAVNAISKARFDSPSMRGGDGRQRSLIRKSSQMSSQDTHYPTASQQSMHTVASDSGFASNLQNSQRSFMDYGEEPLEPPRKRMRSSSAAQPKSFNNGVNASSMTELAPTEPSDSFYQQLEPVENGIPEDPSQGLRPLPAATNPERFQKMKLIMTLFLDKRMKDFANHPAFLTLTSEDLEIPLDEYLNSALHWAAMLARMPLVNALVEKGVSIYRLNAAGQTALQKAVGTRNNLDYRTFPKLLQVLGPSIEIIDYNGRTILHHISMMAATGGGGHVAAKHYLESLLEFIVRHGGPSNSQQLAINAMNPMPGWPPFEIVGLGKFMSEIVNIQDDQGDTALNLAGRARTVLVAQLLEVGANPHIPNNTGLRPADYGVGVDMVNGNSQTSQNGNGPEPYTNLLTKTKRDILEATVSQISTAIEQSLGVVDKKLSSSFGEKQGEFNQWHSKIRETAKSRQVEQTNLDELKNKTQKRSDLRRQLRNLEQSLKSVTSEMKSKSNGNVNPRQSKIGDADKESSFDGKRFENAFPPTSSSNSKPKFTLEQEIVLSSLPPVEVLKARLKCYQIQNKSMQGIVEQLKTKNVVLGENYRRMVMACTNWSAEDVDAAADGLTDCLKDLNQNPLTDEQVIEILMKDRGQDW